MAPQLTIAGRADVLFRTAAECWRQRQRYACLVEADGDDLEQRTALAMVALADATLAQAVARYDAAAREGGVRQEEWWHCANRLWLAARDYVRRHLDGDDSLRRLREHSVERLAELTVERDLEASALLALQHAVDAFRRCRPEAELVGPCGSLAVQPSIARTQTRRSNAAT